MLNRKIVREVVLVLVLLGCCGGLLFSVYSRAHEEAIQSNQDEANGTATKEVLGFRYTGIYSGWNDTYVDLGTGVLEVEPGGPMEKAGLKRDDRILMSLPLVKGLLLQRRGKTIVLPVARGKRRFRVTVTVPRYDIPFPERYSPPAPPP